MASSKRDFERFVTWLHRPENQTPPDVRRLANLALAHFDELAQTSRQHNQRSIYLVHHARRSIAQTPDGPPDIQPVAAEGAWPWRRLRHLTLGPFRGFRTPEPFDLQKRVILFYGPNGSGKTSLCEGLEYALLGAVEEADTKRIDAMTYLVNVHANRFEAPVLRATDHQNREAPAAANVDIYRFCFIEKNRIDAFSRIAARPSAQRTELIATLFGMEKFNEFVSHFNDSIDQQLVLNGTKQLALTSLRHALAADQATVDGEAQALLNLTNEEAALALTYSEGMTYTGLKALIGAAEAPGRLQELEGILNAVPPAAIGLTRRGLLDGFEAASKGYLDGDEYKIVRPDFMFFAALDDGKVVTDIVDPHGPYLADALPKLQGLAQYAEVQSRAYRRIESVAKVKGKLRVLDLMREDVRKAIANTKDAASLFVGHFAGDYE
jgi:hypothetical protein